MPYPGGKNSPIHSLTNGTKGEEKPHQGGPRTLYAVSTERHKYVREISPK